MGRYEKGRERRAEILRAALDLIGRNGFRGSTLQDIADAVGVSKAGVLHYFDSKAELYAEVLRLRDREGTPADRPLDVDDFVGNMRENADVPGLVHLFTALAAEAVEEEHGAHAFFVERYADVRERLEHAVRAAVDDGRLRSDVDPARFARMLVALADGLQVQWLLDPSFDMGDDISALLALAGPVQR